MAYSDGISIALQKRSHFNRCHQLEHIADGIDGGRRLAAPAAFVTALQRGPVDEKISLSICLPARPDTQPSICPGDAW